MSKDRPFELVLLVLSFLATGVLGLLNTLYFSSIQGDLHMPLLLGYGLIHPALAYSLWSLNKWALKAERLLTALFIAASLFLYGTLNPARREKSVRGELSISPSRIFSSSYSSVSLNR